LSPIRTDSAHINWDHLLSKVENTQVDTKNQQIQEKKEYTESLDQVQGTQSLLLKSRVKPFKIIKTENYQAPIVHIRQKDSGSNLTPLNLSKRYESQSYDEDEFSQYQNARSDKRSISSISNALLSDSTSTSPSHIQKYSNPVNILSSCTATIARSLGRFLKLKEDPIALRLYNVIHKDILVKCRKVTMSKIGEYLEKNFKTTKKTNKKYLMNVIGNQGFSDLEEIEIEDEDEDEEMKRAIWEIFQTFLKPTEDYYVYWVREIYKPREKSCRGSKQKKDHPERISRDQEKRNQYIAYHQDIQECFANAKNRKPYQTKKLLFSPDLLALRKSMQHNSEWTSGLSLNLFPNSSPLGKYLCF